MLTHLLLLTLLQTPTEVPFSIGEDALIVNATVNGRNVSLMFDTGFGGAIDLANTISIGDPTGVAGIRDFVGQANRPIVKIKTLKLGSKSIDPVDMDAMLSPPANYTFEFGMHCDGIMGFSVIKGSVTEINFEKQKFIFYPSSYDITSRQPDNKKTFLVKMLPLGTNSVMLPVTTPDGKTMTMALDTGNSSFAATFRDTLERVGLWDSGKDPKFTTLSEIATGPVTSWFKRMLNLKVFDVPVPVSTWDVIDLPSSSADFDGTIGFQFLRNFNITIDYARRRVWFEKWTDKIEDTAPAEVGISADYSKASKKVLIISVSPNSPADEAGIKKGDEILSVDSTDLEGAWSFRKLQRLFRGAAGTKIKLAISRNGDLKRFELERRPLVND